MNTLLIALIVAVVGPVLLSWLNGRQRRAEKLEDYARQDDVAARLAKRQDDVADQLLASNKEIADAAAEATQSTNTKLEVIRVDVNSNMTAAKQAELDATMDQVALMREVLDLKRAAGIEPSEETLALIAAKELKIADLQATLKDRLTHGDAAAAAAAAAEPDAAEGAG